MTPVCSKGRPSCVLLCLSNPRHTDVYATSQHWHGFFQAGTSWADGPAFVNQCPISPSHSFLYNFNVGDQAGSFWYHSHYSTQYCDGLRGPIVVYDPADPHADLYDVDDGECTSGDKFGTMPRLLQQLQRLFLSRTGIIHPRRLLVVFRESIRITLCHYALILSMQNPRFAPNQWSRPLEQCWHRCSDATLCRQRPTWSTLPSTPHLPRLRCQLRVFH